jgi:PTH1 family peptidyl-tRNA hydrolase
MNLSGQALSGLLRFYKIPLDRFIVIYDDLDIPFGTIRIRPGGGAGGHKGMSSIIQQLNSNQFARVRLGIGRPPGQMDPSDYVLQNFSAQDSDLLIHILDQTYQVIKTWLSDGISTAMNLYNGPYQKD